MNHPGMYEYYDGETGQPSPTAASAFGWTAAVFIDLAIQASRETLAADGKQDGEAAPQGHLAATNRS
jgi:hypothetical protein